MSAKHETRKTMMLSWVKESCSDEQLKTDLKALWAMDAHSPEMEKIIWSSSRSLLAKVKNSPIDDMKNANAGKVKIAPHKENISPLIRQIYRECPEFWLERGQKGEYPEHGSEEAFEEEFFTTYENRYSNSKKQ